MSARRKPLTRRDEDTLKRIASQERMFMRFSEEQRIQIGRLTDAGGFSTSGGSSTCDETIATLAAAALFVFGLDPIARDAFDQVSSVVYGDGGGGEIINVVINEQAGEKWTANQRKAEREAQLKERAA
jgi:hypothetical protein